MIYGIVRKLINWVDSLPVKKGFSLATISVPPIIDSSK